MKTSARGIAFIAAEEGTILRAYRDVVGVWTIGVGHANTSGQPPFVKAGMTITREEAMRILAVDLPRYERRVDKALGEVPQPVFDAAVSFDFNTGAIHKASWAKAYRAGRVSDALSGLMQWTKAGGRTIGGLVNRRRRECRLISAGDYGKLPAIRGTTGAEGAVIDPPPADPAGPSVSTGEELAAYEAKLSTLGYPSVLAYQKAHPDLTGDGVLGPATRAQIDRDVAARLKLTTSGGGALALPGAAIAAGAPAWIVISLFAAGLAIAGFVVWRYRGELARMVKPKPGRGEDGRSPDRETKKEKSP